MPLSVMSALMLLTAHASGLICDSARCKKNQRIAACMFLLAILFLQRFELALSAEVNLNAASALFVIAALASYAFMPEALRYTLFAFLLGIGLSLVFPSKENRGIQHQSERTIIDQGHFHIRLEDPGLKIRKILPEAIIENIIEMGCRFRAKSPPRGRARG